MFEQPPYEQDEYFAYIAGYTEWGFPYGITWEEWEKLEQLEPTESGGIIDEEEDFDFHFDSLPARSWADDDSDLPF